MQQTPLPEAGGSIGSGTHHLFFALEPADDVRAAIALEAERLKRQHGSGGRWIKPHRCHLTLHFVGTHATLPESLVAAALAAGDAVRATAFDFQLDRAGSFANRSIPWWIGCTRVDPRLAALHDQLAAELGGTDREPKPFVPHVTVLRDATRRLDPARIAPIAWHVDAFVLIDSTIGAQAHHAVLRRWPLTA
jgi:2'-5' RNA ligase